MGMTEEVYQDTIAFFISFCVEMYKNARGCSGAEAYESLSSAGALDYLAKNYETIHTQSPQWILEEIHEFMDTRKATRS